MKLTNKDLHILEVLDYGSKAGMFGKEIVKATWGHLWHVGIYVRLAQLVELDLVSQEEEHIIDGFVGQLPRSRYNITGNGRRALQAAR